MGAGEIEEKRSGEEREGGRTESSLRLKFTLESFKTLESDNIFWPFSEP